MINFINRPRLFLTVAVGLVLPGTVFAETAVTINYGTVTAASTIKEESKHAGGALAGGLLGAVIGPSRHRGLRIAASAAAGAAILGSATDGTAQQYTIKLVTGGQELISTEQDDIRVNDCVAVEQGEHTNLRRVGSAFCDGTHDGDPPKHQQDAAGTCDAAKDELAAADSDDDVNIAVKKVRVLCDL
jgi:outer membrane lipoprotein SlyB